MPLNNETCPCNQLRFVKIALLSLELPQPSAIKVVQPLKLKVKVYTSLCLSYQGVDSIIMCATTIKNRFI